MPAKPGQSVPSPVAAGRLFSPTLETERLLLRRPRPEDAEPIFCGYAQDPEVVRYMLWAAHRSPDETRGFVQHAITSWGEGLQFPWVVTLQADGAVVGMIELRLDFHVADVGFVLRRSVWGRGLATEALRRVLREALALPALDRVSAICHVDNRASARVMEKAGMTREARWDRHETFPNLSVEPQDVYCYAVTARSVAP